ncbi:ubiquinone biosynthesis protein UbiB [Candidatus Pelagibacter sp.]|nr:ubiquinone biosynthesis protein UbiB [Candidatus Pelagibacter sp.]
MKVCILGDGLTSLALAKALVNKGISTDVYPNRSHKKKHSSRSLGISKSNVEFFNKDIVNIDNFLWNINKIEIYSESLNNTKIIEFKKNNQTLFSTIKNHELIAYLKVQLKKSKYFKFKNNLNNYTSIKKKYSLIINCESNNKITNKFFYQKINKNYNSFAYTSIIQHEKLLNNNIATQTFTKEGPIAFLPISNKETSVVYSLKGGKRLEIESLIRKFNTKYKINKINKVDSFELISSNLRSYYYKNILAFGDLLHKIHPLAGQGFNMSIRDIKVLTKIIDLKINLGLDLDSSVCVEFENKNKHKNYIFSNGIDFIHEFFNLENRMNSNILSKSIKFFANNKISNKFFVKFADEGILN